MKVTTLNPSFTGETMTDISVIIPTLNAARYLEDLLESLNNQNVKAKEILIVDSESEDKTVAIARRFGANIIKIKRKFFNHGGTRNFAASLTKGDVLIFLTQDALPDDRFFIQNLTAPLSQVHIAAAFGRQKPRPDAAPHERFARLFNYPEQPLVKGLDDRKRLGIKTFYFTNVCSAVRRKEFEEVGQFPQRVILNEDMVLASKLIYRGYHVAYVPNAVVIHSHNYTLAEQLRRYFDIGVSLKENSWILQDVKAEGEGLKFAKTQVNYLIKEGEYRFIPHVVGELFSKYIGFKLGLHFDWIPVVLRKKLSMNRTYWETV
jgi:rhamnosyltransferase